MADKIHPKLNGVPETLLMPLYMRALESQRPDGWIKDDKAVAMVSRIDYDFARLKMQGHDEVAVMLRMCEFDRMAREFLARNPAAGVVHIGCGLDTRFERVDNGQVEWFDLDLPEVNELRGQFIETDCPRYHLLSGSVHEDAWLEKIVLPNPRLMLFLAEGVLPYFEEAQVRALFVKLRARFPGAELVCDAQSPFFVRMNNLQLAFVGIGARLRWGLKNPKDVENWAEGISLVEKWYYFDHPEPRFGAIQWMRYFPLLSKAMGVFHYRLGS
jgi:O-methyltransferase involved in polyketide biosynthesis